MSASSCARASALGPRSTESSSVSTVSALSVPCGQCGALEVVAPCPSPFLSLAEAPEEPLIQVNALGISVNSEEPGEVRSAGVAGG